MKSFLELARWRRSIRRYTDEPVDEAAMERILEAGRIAPSGNNSQPWRFVVVRSPVMKKRLFEVCGRQPFLLEAPIVVAVIGDMTAKLKAEHRGKSPSVDDPRHMAALIKTVRDATIAADHIVLAAADEGLGTCWVALFEQEEIKPVLHVPQHCFVVTLITIGHAAEEGRERPRHAMDEILFEERYDAARSAIP